MTISEKINNLKQQHETLQVGLQPDEIQLRPGLKFKINEASRFGFEFWCFRSPEEMVLEMNCFIKYAYGRKTFVDIGAFHGVFSLVFGTLNPSSSSFAFEPSPDPYSILLLNCKLNSQCHIKPVRAALMENDGLVSFKKEWDHYIECSETEKEESMTALSGDGYFSTDLPIPIKIDTIKIDTEGSELRVLKGLRTTIEMYHPLIFLELHLTRLSKPEVDEVIEFIRTYNYMILDSRTDADADIDSIVKEQTDLRLILI